MNGKLNTDNYPYQLNQTYRDDALRTAEAQRLARIAAESNPQQSLFSGLRRWFLRPAQPHSAHYLRTLRRVLHLTIGMLVVMAMSLATAAPGQAQSSAASDPGSGEPYHPSLVSYRLGIFYQVRGEHERAIGKFTEAIEGLPGLGYAYAARGDSYAALDEYSLSLADYTQALTIYPDFVSVLYTRGEAYLAVGDSELAEADFASAIEQMPEYALPYAGLGDAAFSQGDYNAARAAYAQYMFLLDDVPDAAILEHIDMLETMAAAGTLG